MIRSKKTTFSFVDCLWNAWCVASLVGIWPRFIEPNLLSTTYLQLDILNLPHALDGLKILQFSDLHLHSKVSNYFLNKLIQRANSLAPDLVVFTGDFLCYSKMEEKQRLKRFLNGFKSTYGCYAVLGNHDYHKYVSVNEEGDYNVVEKERIGIQKGFKRLFSKTTVTKRRAPEVSAIGFKQELIDLLKETNFTVLHNETKRIQVGSCFLNLCGLGEYTLGKFNPEIAFKNYDKRYPGISLVHNPDAVPYLKEYPSEVVLCGHTHGGQVNIPFLREKFTLTENKNLIRGLVRVNDKWVYINRGVGSVMPFRWFSFPEFLLLTLSSSITT